MENLLPPLEKPILDLCFTHFNCLGVWGVLGGPGFHKDSGRLALFVFETQQLHLPLAFLSKDLGNRTATRLQSRPLKRDLDINRISLGIE
eukprot:1668650-Amphidinium_carterae.1